eukprot:7880455-Pyramimonas_sp.AAC.1
MLALPWHQDPPSPSKPPCCMAPGPRDRTDLGATGRPYAWGSWAWSAGGRAFPSRAPAAAPPR